MEFDVLKSKVVPFSMTEAEIRQNFLDWVILGDSTPIDIAYKADIKKVSRRFYPIRIVEANYTASWSAVSTWEHEEEYTENVLYIKYQFGTTTQGNPQYSTMKAEKYYSGPNYGPAVDKFYKQETKTRTVTDKVEQTIGSVEGWYGRKVITLPDNQPELIAWLDSVSIEGRADYSDALVQDARIQPLCESDEYAKEQINPAIQKQAAEECEKEVPGNRHEDFQVTGIEQDYKITVVLLPVYEVVYEYEGREYTAQFSGCVKDSVFSDDKPQDADLAAKKAELDQELETKKSARLKAGLIGFGAVAVVVILLLIINSDIGIIALIAAAIFEIVFVKMKFLPLHREVKDCESKINVHLGNLDEKRRKVAAIVKQDNLTAEEQKAKIKEVIEQA